MPVIEFYTRRGCHLCEEMLEELLPMLRGRAELQTRDVDTRPGWRSQYDTRVPVVEYRGAVVSEYPLDRDAVRAVLAGIADTE